MKKRKKSRPAKPQNIKTIANAFPNDANGQITSETILSEAIGGGQASRENSCPINHLEPKDNKIISYTLGYEPTKIRPAPPQRQFMDNTSSRFAYRCLPLNIANQYGWELLSPCTFDATWNGGDDGKDIDITVYDEGWPPPISHFGHGVLTFHVNQVFRTPKGTQLMITGPMNSPKDGIYAMSGIIETDWSHYSFTMNWVFTRPFFPVRFEKDEPFAHIFPVNLAQIEAFTPQYLPMDGNPELKTAFDDFQISRNTFNEDLDKPNSTAAKEKWQKGYFRGNGADGCPVGGFSHWTKLNVKPFTSKK